MSTRRLRVGVLATHPIQYYSPWYRALAKIVDLEVLFSHRQTPEGQAAAGFGVKFERDVPLLDGYTSRFLHNVASMPDVERFWGCNTPEIDALIRRRAFDAFIVHGWSNVSYWQAIWACWRTGTPVLVRGDSTLTVPRSAWWNAVKWPAYRTFIPRFDGYLVVGSRARDYLLHYGADPQRCFSAPHAVDNDFFAARSAALRPERARLRRELGVPDDAVVYLFAGRFIGRKEPALFVSAIEAAARQHAGVYGLMAGDGPLRGKIDELISRLDAPVRVAGFLNQTKLVEAYVASDVIVVPSEWETWGLVVNEAMACGLPAVVSAGVACAGDLVVPGVTGEVVPVGDASALTAALTRLAADAPYRASLSQAARVKVDAFSSDAAAAGTLQAILTLAARRPNATVPAVAADGPGARS